MGRSASGWGDMLLGMVIGVVSSFAILAGARVNPESCSRLWIAGARGLDENLVRRLRSRDCVDRPEALLRLVDRRIVGGFRVQIEANPEIPAEDRQRVLLDMLRQDWMH